MNTDFHRYLKVAATPPSQEVTAAPSPPFPLVEFEMVATDPTPAGFPSGARAMAHNIGDVALENAMRYDSLMSLAEIKQAVIQLPPEELTALTSFLLRLSKKEKREEFNGSHLSESVLAREWNSPEEDAACANL